MTFYTRKGDDGTTGLYYGGRVPKDSGAPEAYGTVDEAQAVLGLARAEVPQGGEMDSILLQVERDLYVLMAELATLPQNRQKLLPGSTMVTPEMVTGLERQISTITDRFTMPEEFVLPGQNRLSAMLDLGRVVVRRAERRSITVAVPDSSVIPYLNRLSSLLWALARWQEGVSAPARASGESPAGSPTSEN